MKHKPMNALVVDWDFFFHIDPDWNWGCHEDLDPLIQQALWRERYESFEGEVPEAEGYDDFWQRFRFLLGAPMYLAESNKYAAIALSMHFKLNIKDVGIWLFDQHHDCGYDGANSIVKATEKLSCEDWLIPICFQQGGNKNNVHVVYPDHREDAFEVEPEPYFKLDRKFLGSISQVDLPPYFDMVFVCRSGAWVPPWCDAQFKKFYEACPSFLFMAHTFDDLREREL